MFEGSFIENMLGMCVWYVIWEKNWVCYFLVEVSICRMDVKCDLVKNECVVCEEMLIEW